jgi:hypothetical protein
VPDREKDVVPLWDADSEVVSDCETEEVEDEDAVGELDTVTE